MGQLFPRRSNAIAQASLIGIVVFVSGNVVFWTVLKESAWQTEVDVPLDQPVPFSHQHHVSGLGIDCRYCHANVTRSPFAGIPSVHTCMTCHSQIWQEAPVLRPIRESFAKDQPDGVQWTRVYRLPKFVYFDHSIHVNKGIGCRSCHGSIEKMPLTEKHRTFFMKDCLDCHRQPEKFIRPIDRVFDSPWQDLWSSPENQSELGTELVQQYHIPKYRLTDCNTCHR